MKHQQVSVDYWAMGKAMVTYAVITALVWLLLRLFVMVFTLPRRLRSQQTMQDSLKELQRRFPDLNITEDDLRNAEKELDEYLKESDNKEKDAEQNAESETKEITAAGETEDKKTI